MHLVLQENRGNLKDHRYLEGGVVYLLNLITDILKIMLSLILESFFLIIVLFPTVHCFLKNAHYVNRKGKRIFSSLYAANLHIAH